MDERKILVDTKGARLGTGQKVPAPEGLYRASNESRLAYDIWIGSRPLHRRWPAAGDIFPQAFGNLIGAMQVMDVLPEQDDLRYRWTGATEIDARGDDPTGKTVRQVYADHPEVIAFCMENYRLAIASATGLIDFSIEASANPHYLELETLFLPCSDDNRSVTQVLVYSHYIKQ